LILEGHKWFVLQLLPAFEPVRHRQRTRAAPAPEVPAAAAPPGEAKAVLDTNGMQLKQKLDCALQLRGSVSLDFQQRADGIPRHTSFCWTGRGGTSVAAFR